MAADNKAKVLRDAEKYVRQGKISHAIGEYLKITRNDANDVLILNTIGDLYLRQGKVVEANKYFTQVAENYTRNHFLLKAIAVYRKILNADINNIEINRTLASLYARQGLVVEARLHYTRLADLCTKQGKQRDAREAVEKLAELDPNNASIHLGLADMYFTEGAKDKARTALANAGRAQSKAGNFQAAIGSFRKALELNPTDKDVLKAFLEACVQRGEIPSAVDQIKKARDFAPEDPELREMLGIACLAAGDLEWASDEIQAVVSQDESRYPLVFDLHKACVHAHDLDKAAVCLDSVLSKLLRAGECDRAIEAHNAALQVDPTHVLTLTRLSELYSSMHDTTRYLEIIERLAISHLEQQNPSDALVFLEKILLMNPESEKHLKIHRQAFAEAFPDSPYTPPVAPKTAPLIEFAPRDSAGEVQSETEEGPSLVDVDLLLNYGLKDQAMEQLQAMEARDPLNREVRSRLLIIYKQDKNIDKAAEQSLLLAACYRKIGDEIAVQKLIAEAEKLKPGSAATGFDLTSFAMEHGMRLTDAPSGSEAVAPSAADSIELDLSEDITEIFFKEDDMDVGSLEVEAIPESNELIPEDFRSQIQPPPPAAPLADQLQEVDFYLQLGFIEEARIKLDEIVKEHPNNPDVQARFRQLTGSEKPAARDTAEPPIALGFELVEETPELEEEVVVPIALGGPATPESSKIERPSEGIERHPLATQEPPVAPVSPVIDLTDFPGKPAPIEGPSPPPVVLPASKDDSVTEMFADLLDEVNALTDQEIAREDFETHFGLGIAYREMDLMEDAIREFLAAVKELDPRRSPKEVIQCCGMLSTCFLEKQMPRSAIRWCQTGLDIPQISTYEAIALRYDMGIANLLSGNPDKAFECLNMIFSIDPSYRDVAQRIDDLKRGSGRHAP